MQQEVTESSVFGLLGLSIQKVSFPKLLLLPATQFMTYEFPSQNFLYSSGLLQYMLFFKAGIFCFLQVIFRAFFLNEIPLAAFVAMFMTFIQSFTCIQPS